MQLQFVSKHISIEEFDPITIPDFVVLTGVNGSGKSHLLEAIKEKCVSISSMEGANIVLFNYENFKLDNESSFNGHQLSSEREAAWQFYNQHIKNNATNIRRTGLGENYKALRGSCETENNSFWSMNSEPIKKYKDGIKKLFSSPNLKGNAQAQGVFSLVKKVPYAIDEIQHEEFLDQYKPFGFKNDFLPNQIGKVLWDYYVRYRENQVNEYQNEKHGQHYPAVSDEMFITTHGPKPWDLINQILQEFDTLKYEVGSPEGTSIFGNFQLKLRHTEIDGLEIDFNSLSSGEKVLMALVASIYKSSSDQHFPDVLLLDEVDASLHPSMMKNMLNVIEKIFLKKGVKVIIVTHSPTTIALAPEEAIFIMNRSGRKRIEKKSKQEALSILTEGFATIEQGLKLFDEIAKSNITIITEGKNTQLIRRALKINKIYDVEVLSDVEEISGKNQLKTLFDFISRTDHKNKVIFVWDCDVKMEMQSANNTFPYILPTNVKNTIAKKGIENIFPPELFSSFTKTITLSMGKTIVEFDESRKRDFEAFILQRNDPNDFNLFSLFVKEINRVRNI